ncbi:MAG: PAS domain S-box protein [Thermoplasmatota archaeon]
MSRVDVLFVDDEDELLEQAKIFLERLDNGFNVDTSISAEDALTKIDSNDYEVMVSDYQMPGIDGLEFLKLVRDEKESGIPFIMFTGRGREEVAMKALNLGANRYIQKGGDPKSQYGVLAKAIIEEVQHFETERRLNLATYSIDKASLTIFWISPEGDIDYVNDTACESLGYSKEELLDMNVADIDPNYPREKREQQWKKLKENQILTFESEHVNKDGEIFTVEITSHYLKFGDDEYEFAFVNDITERKEKEEALTESEERYRRLFETAQDGILILKVDKGTIKDANPYIQNLLGYTENELIGKKIWEIGSFHNFAEDKKKFDKLVEEGYVRYEDLPLKSKEGKEVPVEFISNTYMVGEEKVAQCNIREISKRKQAEEALEHLIRSISDFTGKRLFESIVEELIEWFDVDGACVGRVQDDGNTVSSIVMKLDGNWIEDYQYNLEGTPCEDVTEKGSCLYNENICDLYPEDEELKRLGMQGYIGSPILNEDGNPIGVIWAISREKIKNVPPNWEKLLQIISSRAYAEINRMKSEERERFLHSLLRHDLRNKIHIIQGYLQLLKEELEIPKKTDNYIVKAETEARKSIDLIRKISTLRKAKEEEIIEIDIGSLLDEAVKGYEDQFKEMNIDIESNSFKVKTGVLLKEVFSNIIENSKRHSQGSKIKIKINEAEGEIICTIEDDGVGIPDDKKEKIFHRGYTSDKEKGTGLGLFLAKKLIEKYEGRIDVRDSELGGARFDIYLKKV